MVVQYEGCRCANDGDPGTVATGKMPVSSCGRDARPPDNGQDARGVSAARVSVDEEKDYFFVTGGNAGSTMLIHGVSTRNERKHLWKF